MTRPPFRGWTFRGWTIRARITAGSVVIAAIVFAIGLVAAHAQVVSVLASSDSSLAAGDLRSYADEIVSDPTDLVDDTGKGILISVRDPTGRVQLDTLPHHIREAVDGRRGANETFTAKEDGETFVVVGRVVDTANGSWSLWAARSTASSGLALRGLDVVFFVGAAILLLVFGIASWFLAAAALRPVERLRRRAEGLEADSDGVLPVGRTRDEISELATTLNAFLGRVRAATAREKQVVSDAAHELRTPLAALRTQLELAHDEFGDPSALAAQVVSAERSVERLSSLATNLLELSRLESGAAAGRSSTADELVTELMGGVDRARLIGLGDGVEIGFSVELSDPAARFPIGTENFARIVDNLLSNGIAAVRADGAVDVELTEEENGLRLSVSDTGPGMSPEFLPHAFDRFSRPDDSRTSGTGGSGLGLALVHAVVLASKGTVTLHNAERGLVVVVSLPKM